MTTKSIIKLNIIVEEAYMCHNIFLFKMYGCKFYSELIHNKDLANVKIYGEYHYLPGNNHSASMPHFEKQL